MRALRRLRGTVACLAAALALGGCATGITRDPVPAALSSNAQVPGMAGIRVWGDSSEQVGREFIAAEAETFRKKYAARRKSDAKPQSHLLAISGGADDGAFSAGLLVGWSENGSRPQFDLVTGVSAGALVAPFAFLGKNYDRKLSEIFTTLGQDGIYKTNILSGVLGGTAVADNAPLAALVSRLIDRKMLAEIAAERANGRLLLVGTTNIDAQRPVFWDMGRIAQGGDKKSLELFHKVLLASAALPGIFPPVEIDVIVDGHRYKELHVDGGPTRQIFLTPGNFRFTEIDRAIGTKVQRHLWVIRNGKIEPQYAPVQASALSIGARSLETLTKNQGIGDLRRIQEKALAENIDFNFISIPSDFEAPRPTPFDQGYMKAIFARGREIGRSGNAWAKSLPDTPTGLLR